MARRIRQVGVRPGGDRLPARNLSAARTAHEPLFDRSRGSRRIRQGQDAADRGDVARAASDDAVRTARHHGPARGAHLPARRRRPASPRPATSRDQGGSRFGRPRRPPILQGRSAGHARASAPSRVRRVRRPDRRRPEDRQGRGNGDCDPRQALRAGRSSPWPWSRAAASSSTRGTGLRSASPSAM